MGTGPHAGQALRRPLLQKQHIILFSPLRSRSTLSTFSNLESANWGGGLKPMYVLS